MSGSQRGSGNSAADRLRHLSGRLVHRNGSWYRGRFNRRRLRGREHIITGLSGYIYQPGAPSTNGCAFITKFNPSGTAIEFSVCLANSILTAFALDAGGNIYLAIEKLDPFAVSFAVVKLDPAAQNILYTTPIGGLAESIAVDTAGNVYLTGASGPGLSTTSGVYQGQSAGAQCSGDINAPPSPCTNAFITKLSPSGSIAWTTYLGGAGPDDAHAIAVEQRR